MPNSTRSQIRSKSAEPAIDQEHTRRGALLKMVSVGAAFATGLFVSNRADASHCCDCSGFPPLGDSCLLSAGLCFHDQEWKYIYEIREGTPNQGCCVDFYGVQCAYLCSTQAIC